MYNKYANLNYLLLPSISETKDEESDYSSSDEDENSTELSGRTVTSAGKEVRRIPKNFIK